MRLWRNTQEYKRILDILEDYWITEMYEDYVDVKIVFIKGGEFQTKRVTWERNPSKGKLEIEPVNFADVAKIMESIETGLDEFVKTKSKELQIDEREVWENIEYYADMYFVNQRLKAVEEDDKD